MTAEQISGTGRTPKHLWIVGVIALLWNAMSAMDYLMTQTKNEAYMGKFTPEQLAFFYGFPTWVVAAWAIAVWAGVLGAVLLLLRKRLAVPVFLASLVAMVITSFHNYVLSDGMAVMGADAMALGFTVLIFVVAIALYMYARAMQKRGSLA